MACLGMEIAVGADFDRKGDFLLEHEIIRLRERILQMIILIYKSNDQRSLDIMKLYFRAFSCSKICWLTTGFSSCYFKLLSYSLHSEYVFYVDLGAMYLFILLPTLLSTFMLFVLMGISESDLFANLNLMVLPRIDWALNLFVACDSAASCSSASFAPPCMLFLYSDKT